MNFRELSGLSFIVQKEIGIWANLINKEIPDAKFIYQNASDFTEIKNYSLVPYFEINLSLINQAWQDVAPHDRVPVDIRDDRATMPFYATYLKEIHERLRPLIQTWQDLWKPFDYVSDARR
ncbi:MAG: hypothetical protein Q4A55_06320 [Aerococcus sp.]|nr:hypothetical protein [Aerococcus sp.]